MLTPHPANNFHYGERVEEEVKCKAQANKGGKLVFRYMNWLFVNAILKIFNYGGLVLSGPKNIDRSDY